MTEQYKITKTANAVYIDKGGKALVGFSVLVYLPAYEEELEIHVPSLDTQVVKTAVSKLVADRQALDALGK